jgi:hypothetical protein
MGLAAVEGQQLGGIIPVGAIFKASCRIGQIGQGSVQMDCTVADSRGTAGVALRRKIGGIYDQDYFSDQPG